MRSNIYKNCKRLLLVILGFLLIIVCFIENKDNFDEIDYSSLVYNDKFVVGVVSNNNYGVYDKNNQFYYFSKNIFNSTDIHIVSPYEVKYSIQKISDDEYYIYIYSDRFFQERVIKLLDNSIISIVDFRKLNDFSNTNFNLLNVYKREERNILFQIMDNDTYEHFSGLDNFSSAANLRVRGSSSTLFPKKSFKLEFSSKKALLGMASDDDWILDALYMDKSKIRNMLSYDLWNEVNDNQSINNDLHGQFVEVFINNEYDGLFVLKQKVGKGMLNVSKDGFLAKAVNHINDDYISEFMSADLNINNDNCKFVLGNLELKYCTDDSLKVFVDRINTYYNDFNYDNVISDFDIKSYINYYTFISFISGVDNVSKNLYYSLVDVNSKLFITPWDMDLTWGLDWTNSNKMYSIFSMDLSSDINWLNSKIINNMDEMTVSLMKKRYWELRKNVITMDNINSYLDSYKNTLVNSGAAQRDSDRWYQYDVEYEIEQIREWARKRIDFLDEYFK